MTPQPQLIYFDVGGVLMHFYHIRDHVAARLGVDEVAFGALMKELEAGRSDGSISEQAVERRIVERFQITQPSGFWSDLAWMAGFQPISEMHDLVVELAQRYRVGILSNVSREVYEKGRSIPGLWPEVVFNPTVLSFEVGFAKPDPRIFLHAIEMAGCKPEEILFIDDVAANVTAARTAGMQAFLFHPTAVLEDVVQLRSLLK